ncbi:glycosyltransferase family 1 protein [Algoriphagus aestuarii]|nr:glycosyltransferase family 1 protein [Algoriphagus aestuarii]
MKQIKILNIPNYYSSYYLWGMNKGFTIRYQADQRFEKWNGKPFLIFEYQNKLIAIDNDDPIGIHQDLYNQVDHYFATNKLIGNVGYSQKKVSPLFPHYPINNWKSYTKLFGLRWPLHIGTKSWLKDIYAQRKRPIFQNFELNYSFNPYVFFAGSIWKKEQWANEVRASFIKACRENPDLTFEGGLLPRTDGNNLGFDEVLSEKRYTSEEFSTNSAKSLVAFNNPAVLGAISWRVAELFNRGSFILNLPWMIELPILPKHGEEIHMLQDIAELPEFFQYILLNPDYHKKIALGGKAYFEKFCTPESQIKYILDQVKADL